MVIPIGITARNEAKNIMGLLTSLNVAIARASDELASRYRVHVLLNDNHDSTPELLARVADINVLHTSGGIVEAQRTLAEIVERRLPFGLFRC